MAEESVETGVNRPGRDYKDFEMEPTLGGFQPCQAACRNDSWCRAWTYVAAGVQGPKAHCWLKKSVPEPVKDSCCVSGVSGVITGLEFDTDRKGNNYRDFGIGFQYVELSNQVELRCRTACEKEEQCKAWTYVKPAKEGESAHCYLKNKVPKATKNNCCISGVVTRADPQEVADRDPTGKSIEECEAAWSRNMYRCVARSGGNLTTKLLCDADVQQLRGVCINLAAQGGGAGGGVPAEWADTLNAHNAKRAIHRTPALSWDSNVAAGAQKWANACEKGANGLFVHSKLPGVGENLAWGSNLSGKASVDLWYSEIEFYDWDDPIGSFNQYQIDRDKEVRHFTQVVWRDTTALGCGMKNCGGENLVVCQYKPPGNSDAETAGVLEANVPARTGLAKPKSAKKQAEPAADAQDAATGGGQVTKVIQSVDVFDAPGGNGTQTGFLEAGVKVTLNGCTDNWCDVSGEGVPGGRGFVYNGDDYRSLGEE